MGRCGRGPGAPAHPALLARRRGAAGHLGPGHHAGAAQGAAEPGHLPPAGAGAQQAHHALAGASRRRARLPRPLHHEPRQALPGGRGAGGRPGDHPGCRDAGARRFERIPVCRPAARRAHRGRARAGRAAARAGQRRDRARRPYPARRHTRQRLGARPRRALRRPHGLLQRAGRVSGVHGGSHHAAQGRHLPLHLHRQAARRARRAGRGTQRAVRSVVATSVSGNRGLLPAARGLQLPHGAGAHQEGLPRPRAPRDDGRVEPPAPVHVHQVHRGGGRGCGRARLEGSHLGHDDPHGPPARHHVH